MATLAQAVTPVRPATRPGLPDSIRQSLARIRLRGFAIDTTLNLDYRRVATHGLGNPDSQLFYLRKRIAVAGVTRRLSDDIIQELKFLEYQRFLYRLDSVMVRGPRILARYQHAMNPSQTGEVYMRISSAAHEKGDYKQALELIIIALQHLQKSTDSLNLGIAYNQLAMTQGQFGNWPEVVDGYRKALSYLKTRDDVMGKTMVFNNLANVYMNQPDSALHYLRQARQTVAHKGDGNELVFIVNTSFIELFLKQHMLDSARHYIDVARASQFAAVHPEATLFLLISQAQLEQAQRHWAAVLPPARRAVQLSRRLKMRREERDAYLLLADAHGRLGRYDSAYTWLDRNASLTDSILAPELAVENQKLLMQFNDQARQQAIADLEDEHRDQDALIAEEEQWLWAALVLVLVLAGSVTFGAMTYRSLRTEQVQRSHYSALLETQQRQLLQASQTKDQLLAIIANDLRLPFSTLANLPDQMQQVLDQNLHDPQTLKIALAHMRQTTHEVTHLLDSLLTWAQAQQHTLDYRPEPVPLLPLLQRWVSASPQLSLQTTIEAAAFADAPTLETLLRNLLAPWLDPAGAAPAATLTLHTNGPDLLLSLQLGDAAAAGVGLSPLNESIIDGLVQHNRATLLPPAQGYVWQLSLPAAELEVV